MAAPILGTDVSVESYLKSSFSPDVDYVDGRLEERNLGEYDHASIQTTLAVWFSNRARNWNVRVVVEQRVQVSPTRFRIPDVCVFRRDRPIEQIITHPPMICIEVLSPEDSIHRYRDRIADYFRMGVEHVWILDPASRDAFVCAPTGWNQPEDGKLAVPGTDIVVELSEIFSALDE